MHKRVEPPADLFDLKPPISWNSVPRKMRTRVMGRPVVLRGYGRSGEVYMIGIERACAVWRRRGYRFLYSVESNTWGTSPAKTLEQAREWAENRERQEIDYKGLDRRR